MTLAALPQQLSQAVPLHALWHGIDLRWAYANLLPAINQQTRCLHRSSDILHDALIRFVVSLSPHRDEKPHAYLRTIVQHLITDEYHQAKRFDSLELFAESWPEESLTLAMPSAEFLTDMKQRLSYVQKIIDDLPPRCRETFWLYRIEGYTQPVIAEKLGISKNMVERHMMRAIVDLSGAKELILAE